MPDQPGVKVTINLNDLVGGFDKLKAKFDEQLRQFENLAATTKRIQEEYNLTGSSASKAADDISKLTNTLVQAQQQQQAVTKATVDLNRALSSGQGAASFAKNIKNATNEALIAANAVRDKLTAGDFGIRRGGAPPGEDPTKLDTFFNQFRTQSIAASRAELAKFQTAIEGAKRSITSLLAAEDQKGEKFLFSEEQISEVFRAVRLKEQLDDKLFRGPTATSQLRLVNPEDFPRLVALYGQVVKLFDAYERLGTSVNKVKNSEILAREAANSATLKQIGTTQRLNDEIVKNTNLTISAANKRALAEQQAEERALATRVANRRHFGELEEKSNQENARLARVLVQKEIEARNEVKAQQFVGGIQAQIGIPKNADIGKVLQLNAALATLQNQTKATNAPLNELQSLFARIKLNPGAFVIRELNTLPAELRKVALSMIEVDRAQQLVERSGKAVADSLIISWRGIARIFEAQVIHRALTTIYNDLLANVRIAAELQVKISEIRTVAQEAQLPFGHIQESIKQLSDEFGNTQADIAAAAYEALSNQVVRGTETFQFLRQALILSQTTVTDAKTAVNLLSSAINAYKLQASDAQRINAIFFKTIELGRLQANEISDTFGRTGVLAQKLGISIEEVGAALATTTVQGFRVDESQTLLTNLMLKLLKPTEAFTGLLEELGFKSGEAAVQAIGLGGILQLLSEQGEKGADVLALQVNELRALKGAFALTGDSLSLYQRNLERIKSQEAVDQTTEAARLIRESSGKEFLIFQQQVKNVFIETGNTIIDEFLKIKKAIEDIGNVFTPLTGFFNQFTSVVPLIKSATAALVTYTVVTRLAAVANSLFAGSQVANIRSLVSLPILLSNAEIAVTRLRTAMTALNVSTAAVTALFTVITFDAANTQETIRQLEFGGAALATRLDKQTQDVKNNTNKANEEIKQGYLKRNEEIFRDALQTSARLIATADKEAKDLVSASKSVTDALKLGFDQYVKSLGDAVKKTKETIEQNKTQLENNAKFLQGLAASQPEKLFQQALKFEEDPINKLKLIQGRIQELRTEIASLFAKGDDESIKSAQTKVNEINKLIGEKLEIQVNRRKEEASLLAQQGLLLGGVNSQGKQVINVGDLIVKARREEADLLAEITKLSKINEENKKKENQELERGVKQEEARIAAIIQTAKELEGFKLLNEKGEVVKNFATPEGELDVAKAQAEAKRLADAARALIGKEGEEQVSINKLINEKIRIEEAASLSLRNEQRAKFQQQELINLEKANTALFNEQTKAIANEEAAVLAGLDRIAKIADQFRRTAGVGSRQGLFKELTGIDILPGIPGILETERRFRAGSAADNVGKFSKEIEDLVAQVKELKNQGQPIDPKLYEEIATRVALLNAELKRNIAIRNEGILVDEKGATIPAERTTVDLDGERQRIGTLINEIEKLSADLPARVAAIQSRIEERQKILDQQTQISTQIQTQLGTIKRAADAVGISGEQAATKLAAFADVASRLASGVGPLAAVGALAPADTLLNKQLLSIGEGAKNVKISLNDPVNVDLGIARNQNKLEIFIAALKDVAANIDALNKKTIDIRASYPPGFVPQVRPGAEIQGRAFGGFLQGNIGTDSTIFRGTRGEFVVNPISSAKFSPQLQDINAGRYPQPTVGGSITNNSTNVGDIVIQVNQNVSEQELAQILKRGIRRGSIRFN